MLDQESVETTRWRCFANGGSVSLQNAGYRTVSQAVHNWGHRPAVPCSRKQSHAAMRFGRRLHIPLLGGRKDTYALQVVPIRASEQSQRRNRHSFPRTQGSGQAHRVGVSKAFGLFELWIYRICNSRIRVTTASGRRCGYSAGPKPLTDSLRALKSGSMAALTRNGNAKSSR